MAGGTNRHNFKIYSRWRSFVIINTFEDCSYNIHVEVGVAIVFKFGNCSRHDDCFASENVTTLFEMIFLIRVL